MRHLVAALFCGALAAQLSLAGSAFGQAASTPTKGEDEPLSKTVTGGNELTSNDDGTGNGLLRTFIALAIVIAVIYGITWILKQIKHSRDETTSGHGLSATATLPLGAGRSVQVVRAGDEFLLLGVTDGAVGVLRTYTEADAIAAGFVEAPGRPGDGDGPVRPLRPERPASHDTFATRALDRLRGVTVRR